MHARDSEQYASLLLLGVLALGCGSQAQPAPVERVVAPDAGGAPTAGASGMDSSAGSSAGASAAAAIGGATGAGASGDPGAQAGAYAGTSTEAGRGAAAGAAGTDPSDSQPGQSLLVGVGSWGLRGRSTDGSAWQYCGNPSTGNDHSADLLRAVGYGDGVFVAVGGDANGMVMRSLDGEHWEQDVHPLSACPGETYPSSCNNWMGAVTYLDGVWLAGGGNGATMRSEDAGRSWHTLYGGFPEKHIRTLGSGAGRFIAGTDGGGLWVSSDRGDSWTSKPVWSSASASDVLQISYGNRSFVAYSGSADACFVSADLGESWQPCASAAQGGSAYLFDGERWVAALSDAFATSPDAQTWTFHPAAVVPRELLFDHNGDSSQWFGRSGSNLYRGGTLDDMVRVASDVSDFRAWTLGSVLTKNLPVLDPPACQDQR